MKFLYSTICLFLLTTIVSAGECLCGPDCPCKNSANQPSTKPTFPRPDGEGWQWDAKEKYWWKWNEKQPVNYNPVFIQPVEPTQQRPLRIHLLPIPKVDPVLMNSFSGSSYNNKSVTSSC